jgi:hypothetical protein
MPKKIYIVDLTEENVHARCRLGADFSTFYLPCCKDTAKVRR